MSRIFWPIFLSCMYYPLRVYLTRKFRQDNRINSFELVPLNKGGKRVLYFWLHYFTTPFAPFSKGDSYIAYAMWAAWTKWKFLYNKFILFITLILCLCVWFQLCFPQKLQGKRWWTQILLFSGFQSFYNLLKFFLHFLEFLSCWNIQLMKRLFHNLFNLGFNFFFAR